MKVNLETLFILFNIRDFDYVSCHFNCCLLMFKIWRRQPVLSTWLVWVRLSIRKRVFGVLLKIWYIALHCVAISQTVHDRRQVVINQKWLRNMKTCIGASRNNNALGNYQLPSFRCVLTKRHKVPSSSYNTKFITVDLQIEIENNWYV